jgi:exonuclease SbcD
VFTFLHTADIHLDSPLQNLEQYEGAPVEALRQATRRAFENMIGMAVSAKVDFVLICGDLYDGNWKDYNTGLYFVSQVRKLREANIPAYIVTGNHDAASNITKTLRLPDGIHLLPVDQPGTCFIEKLGVAIHGQGFATQAVKKDISAGYPPAASGYFNIGMLHTCATGNPGHEPYAPCTLKGLASKGYDYWALGHVHQQEILRKIPLIVFPGNLQGRHIRETGPKGCMQVSVDDKGRAHPEFLSFDVVRWIRCEIDASETDAAYDLVDKISERLREVMEENSDKALAVRVEISGTSPAMQAFSGDPERWTNEVRSAAIDLGGDRLWLEKIKMLTGLPTKARAGHLKESSPGSPLDEIQRFLDNLQADPGALAQMGDVLKELIHQLPHELKDGEEAINPEDPDWLSRILDQARPLLLQRLLEKESVG